jgi:hypothetical protein
MTLARQRPRGLHWRHWLERPAQVRHGSACDGSDSSLGRFAPLRNAARGGACLRTLSIECKSSDSARRMRGRGNGSEPERPNSSPRAGDTFSIPRDVIVI